MKTTDWTFDFSSLPGWDIRQTIPYVYDEFFEIPQSDMVCCIYSIAEVTMGHYLGHLAILKNKEDPQLVLNITKEYTFGTNCSVNKTGDLIFLQPNIYNHHTHTTKRPILIIDIQNNRFSYLKTDNINPCYTVVEINDRVFKIEADAYQKKHDKRLRALSRKKIRLHRLKWYDVTQLDALAEWIL